ncbi:MAG: hypothetical protein HY076_06720 [Candidatus Eisenbacteria bacterium]|uniref:Uncharacterized protein n=1 Tax=Eiseniibacteriota bacterium TaxID=2212470 RepID=A0A9D6QPH5_UNCEI|nr:hypothetical protein [Candidatus Eisenbacteria bacterium]MBI3539949.1 hypothetical protein [Candidatus Eisenbacteria bacterium]
MTRSYRVLIAIVLAFAVILTLIGRPRPHAAMPRTASAAAPAPAVDLALTVGDGTLTPAVAAVLKGSRVRITVACAAPREARLALSGYEDRLAIPPLAPGASWRGEFLADRPGDDFAWLLDGRPAARLAVTGSHLVDGHR